MHHLLPADRTTCEQALPGTQARGLGGEATHAVAEAGQTLPCPARCQVVEGFGREPYKVWLQLIECSPRSMKIKARAETGTASNGRRVVACRTLTCTGAGWERRVIDDAVAELI